MSDRRADEEEDRKISLEIQWRQRGYEGVPGYRGRFGRDFGGGYDQGFDGSWGQGYGGSLPPFVYREEFDPDDRSWVDLCADDELWGRSHHRGRGPQDWSRDDQLVYVEVCERLLHDRLIDARGIEVEVEDGVVSLRGEVRAAADPVLAARLVGETPGVKGVRLELILRPRQPPPQPEARSDERIDKSPLGYPILPT